MKLEPLASLVPQLPTEPMIDTQQLVGLQPQCGETSAHSTKDTTNSMPIQTKYLQVTLKKLEERDFCKNKELTYLKETT